MQVFWADQGAHCLFEPKSWRDMASSKQPNAVLATWTAYSIWGLCMLDPFCDTFTWVWSLGSIHSNELKLGWISLPQTMQPDSHVRNPASPYCKTANISSSSGVAFSISSESVFLHEPQGWNHGPFELRLVVGVCPGLLRLTGFVRMRLWT